MLGEIGGRRRRGRPRMRWLDSITDSMGTWVWVNSGRWWWTGRPGILRFMGSQRVGHDWATELNYQRHMVNSVSHAKVLFIYFIYLHMSIGCSFEPTHWKRPWCWERLRAGGEEGNRGWDGWMTSSKQWTWVWAKQIAKDRERWLAAVHWVTECQTPLSDWTTTIGCSLFLLC